MLVETRQVAEMPSWRELDSDRSSYQRYFAGLLLGSPRLKGRVLDIGCGGRLNACLSVLVGRFESLDGVDPDPKVLEHPLLRNRWNGPFESCPAPAGAYDLAYSFNVLEHIARPRPFFEKVARVLKTGGEFWALTPNSLHPFAAISRSIEIIGLKGLARKLIGANDLGLMSVNDYPAYYRCNTARAVIRQTRGLPFRSACFYHHPCLQWDTYFPRFCRWAPRLFDYLAGTRFPLVMQTFILGLERG